VVVVVVVVVVGGVGVRRQNPKSICETAALTTF